MYLIELWVDCLILYPENKLLTSSVMFNKSELDFIKSKFDLCLGWLYRGGVPPDVYQKEEKIDCKYNDTTTDPAEEKSYRTIQDFTEHPLTETIKLTNGYSLWFARSLVSFTHSYLMPVTSTAQNPKNKSEYSGSTFFRSSRLKLKIQYLDESNNVAELNDTAMEKIMLFYSASRPKIKRNGIILGEHGSIPLNIVGNHNVNKNQLSIHFFLLNYIQYGGGVNFIQYKTNSVPPVMKELFLPQSVLTKLNDEQKYESLRLALNSTGVNGITELISITTTNNKFLIYQLFKEVLLILFKKHKDYINLPTHISKWNDAVTAFENDRFDLLDPIATRAGLIDTTYNTDTGFKEIAMLYKDVSETVSNTKLDIFIMYIAEYTSLIVKAFEQAKSMTPNPYKMQPITLEHVASNINAYSLGKLAIVEYNCRYSIYEGYAINRALYELTRDLKYISRKLSGGEYIELFPTSQFTKKCLASTQQESPLETPDSVSPQFGIILRILISCILNKTYNKASEYLNSTVLSSNDIIETIKHNLKLFTFTILHYTTEINGQPINNPPTIPYIKNTKIKIAIYIFNRKYKLYEYEKMNHPDTTETIYDKLLQEQFEIILVELKTIFGTKHYEKFYDRELIIAINAQTPSTNPEVEAFKYLKTTDVSTIVSLLRNNIPQMKAYVDLIENQVVVPMENIMGVSLIGTLATTQSFINASTDFICSDNNDIDNLEE
jgi:hypothetical protein